jgi:hypothetical protein
MLANPNEVICHCEASGLCWLKQSASVFREAVSEQGRCFSQGAKERT